MDERQREIDAVERALDSGTSLAAHTIGGLPPLLHYASLCDEDNALRLLTAAAAGVSVRAVYGGMRSLAPATQVRALCDSAPASLPAYPKSYVVVYWEQFEFVAAILQRTCIGTSQPTAARAQSSP